MGLSYTGVDLQLSSAKETPTKIAISFLVLRSHAVSRGLPLDPWPEREQNLETMSEAFLILGNQLFSTSHLQSRAPKVRHVFMAEDHGLCTYVRHHKHKIIFFLSSMRAHAQDLERNKYQVTYHYLTATTPIALSYEERLSQFVSKQKIRMLHVFEIEDKFFETRIVTWAEQLKVKLIIHPSPMFLHSRLDFQNYLKNQRRPFMKSFYENSRIKTGVLMNKGKPMGAKFSHDTENRKKIPAKLSPPQGFAPKTFSRIESEVCKLVDELFPDHPGATKSFLYPTTRAESRLLFQSFLQQKLEHFGAYQDALDGRSPFWFHSLISASLNVGHLLPQEVLEDTLQAFTSRKLPLNSVEGFVRQVLGWREFVRGIYQNFSEAQESSNFFNHQKRLSPVWYRGETGIPPLDESIESCLRFGYAHHIQRLMVLANFMNLCQIQPQEAHRWFMEMFVDSSDWVMGPNVYGMGLFSDGGLFATKPYICGSNYLRKMGGYPNGDWCQEVDGLYWGFIDRHRSFFKKNYRMSSMVTLYDRMATEKKRALARAASAAEQRLSSPL